MDSVCIVPAGVFHRTFTSLAHIEPDVLYPIPDFTQFDGEVQPPSEDLIPPNASIVFLSINRYERKKNLALALQAMSVLLVNSHINAFLNNISYSFRLPYGSVRLRSRRCASCHGRRLR
jgi:alpha-1,3/alpha-1,6-mannosyltransferase